MAVTSPSGTSVSARVRARLRALATRFGGLPHSEGTVDSPPPEVAGDITALWKRNSNPLTRDRIVDPTTPAAVTMTTHGVRIDDVWLAIESIGRGTVRPGRIVLWLDGDEPLPRRLRRLERRGLEVRRTAPGLKVHTKYYPFVAGEGEVPALVLADDDIVYPPDWLEGLLRAQRATPEHVIAYRAHVVGFDDHGGFAPYTQWRSCDTDVPSYAHFATSVSGQILPPVLQRALKDAGTAFLELAPTADDIWLHATAVRAGLRTRQVIAGQRHWWFIPGSQETGLNAVNVRDGGNDRQMRATHDARTIARMISDG